MTPSWDPGLYLRFDRHRLQPAIDLLQRIDHPSPALVYDLGSGTGNVTRVVADRWQGATVIGVDRSVDMLERSRTDHPDLTWLEHDLTTWVPTDEPDVIFSNAAFHWVPNHLEMIPRLFGALASGGQLAIQMPLSWYEPGRALQRSTLADLALLPDHLTVLQQPDVQRPAVYIEALQTLPGVLDLWTTTYHQILTGEDPVFRWFSGSSLRTIHDRLSEADRKLFDAEYKLRLSAAYPQNADATTLLPFPRLFMTLRRP